MQFVNFVMTRVFLVMKSSHPHSVKIVDDVSGFLFTALTFVLVLIICRLTLTSAFAIFSDTKANEMS